MKVAPAPRSLSTAMVPPCRCTTVRTNIRPAHAARRAVLTLVQPAEGPEQPGTVLYRDARPWSETRIA